MNSTHSFLKFSLPFMGIGLLSVVSRAQAAWTKYPSFADPPSGNAPISSVRDSFGILVSIIDFAQVAFWILAAGFGLYAAYLYLFSGGSKEAVSQAQKMLIYTVVAVLVALIAYGIPSIIVNFVGLSTS